MNIQEYKTQIEIEIEKQRVLLNHFLSSDKDIGDLDYNEFLEWVDNEIEDDYRNKFICEWKDYAFLRGKLETIKQCEEIIDEAIKTMNNKIIKDEYNVWDKQRVLEVLEELRKAIFGGENENQ